MLPTAGGVGLIPGWRTKIPHPMWQKKKKNYFKKRMYFILREFHFKKTKCIAKERQVQSHHVRSDTKTAILTTQYSGTYSVQMSLNQEDFCCRLEEREAFYIRCG